jgi:hypothetical protein
MYYVPLLSVFPHSHISYFSFFFFSSHISTYLLLPFTPYIYVGNEDVTRNQAGGESHCSAYVLISH